MKIATWNVNSIKARLPVVERWVDAAQPDVLLMQELKGEDAAFPLAAFESRGYACAVHGQKTYNGVAIASKLGLDDVAIRLPGDVADEQARYVEATIAGVRIASLYLPNGNPTPGPKYDYKLAWMARLRAHAATLLDSEIPTILGGDYNVCPTDDDVYDPKNWADDALCRRETRAAFNGLLSQGWTEALNQTEPRAANYTFWDYQAGAWPKDNGLRIDHFLLSPQAADRLETCMVDRTPRGWEKASDHTPVVMSLAA